MAKIKKNKSALKRVKIKNKCFYTKKSNKSHLLRKKSSKSLRKLSKVKKLIKPNLKVFKRMIKYL